LGKGEGGGYGGRRARRGGGVSEGGEREGMGMGGVWEGCGVGGVWCGRGVNGCGRLMGKGMGMGGGVEVGLMRLR